MSCGNAGLVTVDNAYTPVDEGANPATDVTLAGSQTITGKKTFSTTAFLTNTTQVATNFVPLQTLINSHPTLAFWQTIQTQAGFTIPSGNPGSTIALQYNLATGSGGQFSKGTVFYNFWSTVTAAVALDTIESYVVFIRAESTTGTVIEMVDTVKPAPAGALQMDCTAFGTAWLPTNSGQWVLYCYAYAITTNGGNVNVGTSTLNVAWQQWTN